MSQSQEFRGTPDETVLKKAVSIVDENLELTHSNGNQQMRNNTAEDAAYIALDTLETHTTFKHSQKSYNEEQDRYTEQAFTSETVSPPLQKPKPKDHTGTNETGGGTGWKSPVMQKLEGGAGAGASTADKKNGDRESDDFTHTPLTPLSSQKLWKKTYALQKDKRLQEKLDGKRKEVQRVYTRLSYDAHNGRKLSNKWNKRLEYRGKRDLAADTKHSYDASNEKKPFTTQKKGRNKDHQNQNATAAGKIELARYGRLRYEGKIVREKCTRKDYEDDLRKKGEKNLKRRVRGRLLFRETKSLVDDQNVAEDELFRDMRRTVKRAGRATAISARRNVRTLRLQTNTYRRLELAQMKEQVLHDSRRHLISEVNHKQQKTQIKEAQSREQKKKLKKQMVQQRAQAEGGFLRRTRQNRAVKKRAKEYRRQVRKRIMSIISSLGGIAFFVIIVIMIVFLVLLGIFTGGTNYYAAAVTQNDYSTLTDATEYFGNLETDLDEYLNGDRDALEEALAEEYADDIDEEYGDEIYEYIYDLADFGFSANTLIAYLSAMYGSFDLDMVRDELDSIFDEMYTLTIEIKVEDREISVFNENTGEHETVIQPKNICYITLEKKELEEIVEERLPDDLRFQYDGYRLSTGGQQVYGPVMREDWTNLISSNFGDRIHPITKERKTHNGVDIAVPTGTKVYSAVKGTVILAAYSDSAGNWVKVQTESGWTVVMMHMDSLAVSVGQEVEKGDFLGYSGNTGNSTGPHLHLEVRNPDDKAINPIFIIPQTCAGTGKEEDG